MTYISLILRIIMPLDPTQTTISSLDSDRNYLYTGMGDYRVLVINLINLEIKESIEEDLWEIKSIHVDDKKLYVGSLNEKVNVYRKPNFTKISEFRHKQGIQNLYVDSKFIFTTAFDGNVKIWNKDNYKMIYELQNHLIRSYAINTDNDYIYTGDGFTTFGASLKIWNYSNFSLVKSLEKPKCKRILKIINDDEFIYSAHGKPGQIRIWDKNNFNLSSVIENKYGDVSNLLVDQDYIIASSRDKIIFYDKNNLINIFTIDEAEKNVGSMTIKGQFLFYGARDNLVKFDIDSMSEDKRIIISPLQR